MTTTTRAAKSAAGELRARQACRHLEEAHGLRSATPAYDPDERCYTGAVAVDPDKLLYALATAAEGEW